MKRYLKTIEEVIQALKDGKTVEDKDYKYRLVSGIICSVDKEEEQKGCSNWIVGETIFKWAKPYVMEPEVLKLEVGKFYKTRDGRKAFVYAKIGIDCPYPFCVVKAGKLDAYNVNEEGKQAAAEQPLDLIAPWKENK